MRCKLVCFLMFFYFSGIAQPKNQYAFSGRISPGVCFSTLQNDSLKTWTQSIGVTLTAEAYFKYRFQESFSIAAGVGMNFHQFQFATKNARYGILYLGPKSELIIQKYIQSSKKNKTYALGCGFGYAFRDNNQRLTNEAGVNAMAYSVKMNSFFFSPQVGIFEKRTNGAITFSVQFTAFPSANPFLFLDMRGDGAGAKADYRGNYLGLNITYDWLLNKKVKPPKHEKEKPIIPVPEEFAQRSTKISNEIKSSRKRITIWVYDHGTIDNDSISIQLNNELVLSNYALVREKKKIKIKLQKGENQLILLAHNEGSNPPNSCAVIIRSGLRKQKLILNSTLKSNEGLIIRY